MKSILFILIFVISFISIVFSNENEVPYENTIAGKFLRLFKDTFQTLNEDFDETEESFNNHTQAELDRYSARRCGNTSIPIGLYIKSNGEPEILCGTSPCFDMNQIKCSKPFSKNACILINGWVSGIFKDKDSGKLKYDCCRYNDLFNQRVNISHGHIPVTRGNPYIGGEVYENDTLVSYDVISLISQSFYNENNFSVTTLRYHCNAINFSPKPMTIPSTSPPPPEPSNSPSNCGNNSYPSGAMFNKNSPPQILCGLSDCLKHWLIKCSKPLSMEPCADDEWVASLVLKENETMEFQCCQYKNLNKSVFVRKSEIEPGMIYMAGEEHLMGNPDFKAIAFDYIKHVEKGTSHSKNGYTFIFHRMKCIDN